MPSRSKVRDSPVAGKYPADWRGTSDKIKAAARWKCERCGKRHNNGFGSFLTVHHLDGDKSNCHPVNLAALCQVCRLQVQRGFDPREVLYQLPLWEWVEFEEKWMAWRRHLYQVVFGDLKLRRAR